MNPTSIRELLLRLGLCAGIGTAIPSCDGDAGTPSGHGRRAVLSGDAGTSGTGGAAAPPEARGGGPRNPWSRGPLEVAVPAVPFVAGVVSASPAHRHGVGRLRWKRWRRGSAGSGGVGGPLVAGVYRQRGLDVQVARAACWNRRWRLLGGKRRRWCGCSRGKYRQRGRWYGGVGGSAGRVAPGAWLASRRSGGSAGAADGSADGNTTDIRDAEVPIARGATNSPARHRSSVAPGGARGPDCRELEGALRGRTRFRHRGDAGRGRSGAARRPSLHSRRGRAGDRRRGQTRRRVRDGARTPRRRGGRGPCRRSAPRPGDDPSIERRTARVLVAGFGVGESMSAGWFAAARRACREPLLRWALTELLRDEARHGAFGIDAGRWLTRDWSDADVGRSGPNVSRRWRTSSGASEALSRRTKRRRRIPMTWPSVS